MFEDLIRANDLDIDKIQSSIIDNYRNIDDAQRKDMREWYESLYRHDAREKTWSRPDICRLIKMLSLLLMTFTGVCCLTLSLLHIPRSFITLCL